MLETRRIRRQWRRGAALALVFVVAPLSFAFTPSQPPCTHNTVQNVELNALLNEETSESEKDQHHDDLSTMNRRQALLSIANAATIVPLALSKPSAAEGTTTKSSLDSPLQSLEDLSLGDGQWTRASQTSPVDTKNMIVPATFATFASRILIQYDSGVASWWNDKITAYSLLSKEEQRAKLGKSFACLSMSVQVAFDQFVQQGRSTKKRYEELARIFLNKYGTNAEAQRQIGLLFATLTAKDQPSTILERLATTTIDATTIASSNAAPPRILAEDLSALLPSNYQVAQIKGEQSFTIDPPISLFEVGLDEEFGQTATATAFGPLSSSPLKREMPEYTPDIYALFGLCGATGCALTHTVVIPLDVVKTRAQTDPGLMSEGVLNGAASIVDTEGIDGLLLGAQATIAGYFWYGLSVYPSYTFFKRFLGLSLLPPEVAMIHANDVALVAGALAAVIASLGLTPLEACRIRTVAEPEIYRPIGLFGTASVIAKEDPALGWKTLYAGFPSLLTRQVIFGSVKFLAFEQACEAIFKLWPVLQDQTWTSLGVSLVAGGISGTLSSVVSQPADSVLTYVAQNSSDNLGVLQGCRLMVEREGMGSLFRGLGSRCVWAGSIIAGQFLLYDVFRTYFGVSGEDLSQIFQVSISSQ